ncbi:MAG: lipoyl synthase [Chloroflexota bacterium]
MMEIKRKPEWLKIKLPTGEKYRELKTLIDGEGLHTICVSGKCPNQAECWAAGTATLMILGDVCTRACKFCATQTGKPLPVRESEPASVANTVRTLKLKHAVLTSVDRDDLRDYGAGHWAAVIREVQRANPGVSIEALIPDFSGKAELIDLVCSTKAEVISHNLETVRRLTPLVRSKANYDRSLDVLKRIAFNGVTAKTGIMVGLGETREEIIETMRDAFEAGCDIMTIGQYLQPTKAHLPVERYVTPGEFAEYKKLGEELGLRLVESAPLVRSSYHAEKHL